MSSVPSPKKSKEIKEEEGVGGVGLGLQVGKRNKVPCSVHIYDTPCENN